LVRAFTGEKVNLQCVGAMVGEKALRTGILNYAMRSELRQHRKPYRPDRDGMWAIRSIGTLNSIGFYYFTVIKNDSNQTARQFEKPSASGWTMVGDW